jgi:16S rRNA processing protein RimM
LPLKKHLQLKKALPKKPLLKKHQPLNNPTTVTMSVLPPPLTLVGKIHSKHGYDGRLSIECFATSNKIISKGNYLFVIIDGKGVPFCITDVNKTKELIKLKGIDTEEKAKNLIGLPFGVPSSAKMSVIPQDNALVGFTITDETSNFTGVISAVEELPQGIMFSVDHPTTKNTVLIPLVESWITRIEEKQKHIYMQLPEGLVQLNETP